MSKRLVTIATFDQPAQAHLAKNALDEAGIAATVSDGQLVAMDWLLSNAVGGVKVQVWEEDAEKAVGVLENKFGEHGEGLGATVPPEDLTAQAEAATPDENEEPPEPTSPSSPAELDLRPSERDEYARSAVFTAILGLMFLPSWLYIPVLGLGCVPLVFYAVYLMLNASFGEGELTSRGRFNTMMAGALTLANMVWLFLLLQLLTLVYRT